MPTATKDAVLGSAVELAREAAVEVAENPDHVGEHLGAVTESDRLVSHRFACTAPGYRGWHWTVTLARVPRGRSASVCEAVLLPGDDAVLPQAWVPWAERLRPGDIGPGDVLPFSPDDPRLVPGYVPTGDEEEDRVAIEELALARVRVLSPEGRDRAADRWYASTHGPTAPAALAAAAPCGSCGFLVRLSGSLGTVFGVCANEWSPDDGKVVSVDHGCGAHSETDVEPQPSEWPAPAPSIDELDVEVVARAVPDDAAAAGSGDDAGPADASDAVATDGELAVDAESDPDAAADPVTAPPTDAEPTDRPEADTQPEQ
ncbi:DUF3027 domain-containing protein [Cellulomonas sp. ATA003]|uniref:DUF3027 domain-containing protein n=1 Tax=Cellulomonas sp. ATA003 TaxID=3073064 RepID=UPI002873A4DF|nr:DUF3027 domain-containing protein [Cellulomonas sp. ATA003]WNB85259.1 DUF3027 domain-containing protein [Cellulomonas sp. ATA003]